MLAPSPSQQSDKLPYGLVSLWDLMKEFDAGRWTATLGFISTVYRHASQAPNELCDKERLLDVFKTVAERCEENNLRVTADMARMSIHVYTSNPTLSCRNAKLVNLLDELNNAMISELRTMTFVRVRFENAPYLQKPQLFGQKVDESFPSAIQDIEEAGKCLAYERGGATVFHLMRIMELGLKVLAKPLGIPYAPSWESYLRQIEAKMAIPHKTKPRKWKKDEPFFREVLGDLQAIKIAWRNPTMHIVRHYSAEEAEDVFRAVRTFMKRLAEKFSE